MNIFENELSWLVVGLMPFDMQMMRGPLRSRYVKVDAVYWSFTMQRSLCGYWSWQLQLPLVLRMKDAAWQFVSALTKRSPSNDVA